MYRILQKIPFLIELFFNGSFIILYSLLRFTNSLEGFDTEVVAILMDVGVTFIPFTIMLVVLVNYLSSPDFEYFLRKHIFSLFVFFPMIITWGDVQFTYLLSSVHLVSSILILYEPEIDDEKNEKKRMSIFDRFSLMPAQVVLLSFASLSMLGTFLLMLPLSTKVENGLSFVDALFMSTSAICVTGLSTVSIAENFTLPGQIVILILIQIGGLGYMTISSSLTILLGRSIAMKEKLMMQDLLAVSSQEDLSDMIVDIIKYTFFIELWGGILLTVAFSFEDYELGQAIYYGFFHSVSAFCNAGFSLFSTSLENYATNPIVNFTVITLVTLGGFGFIVIRELRDIILKKKTMIHLSLHTKIVLTTSFVLTVVGTLFIFFGEYLDALDYYSLWDKIQISLFQSVTLRTAGFNSLSLGSLNSYTLYGMTLFMFIGASPGSTGGGLKTTTLAILSQSIITTLRGDSRVMLFKREIDSSTVVRVTALTFITIIIISFSILLFMKIESDQTFISILFEIVSAAGTVGLSLGITSTLSTAGKIALALVMFAGRVGPLTLILALSSKDKQDGADVGYPSGRIMIG